MQLSTDGPNLFPSHLAATYRLVLTTTTPDPGAISIQDNRSSVLNGLELVELCQVLGHLERT